MLNSEESIDLIIANAIPPINGKDAHLTPLVESQSLITKNSASDQAINQRERFEFIIVEPGQALMKKTPATSGTHELDVTGKEIKASPGKNIDFEKPFKGVDISDEDEKIEDLNSKIHISDDLSIKVTGYIYPNVHIDINGQPWSSGESLRRVQIKQDGKNMLITNLADS